MLRLREERHFSQHSRIEDSVIDLPGESLRAVFPAGKSHYRKQLLLKYHATNEQELQQYIEEWGSYDEAIQYSYLLMCNQILEKVPRVPDWLLEKGFLVAADEAIDKVQRMSEKG